MQGFTGSPTLDELLEPGPDTDRNRRRPDGVEHVGLGLDSCPE
jgi:hypothetical protein